jgi:hypothetical protein
MRSRMIRDFAYLIVIFAVVAVLYKPQLLVALSALL